VNDAARTFRPLGARVVALVAGGCLVVMVSVMWFALPSDIRSAFNPLEVVTLLLVLFGVLTVLYGIARTRLDVDTAGLHVTNGYRRHDLEWAEAVAITLGHGAPWAVLDTADGRIVKVMALQSADGPRARAAGAVSPRRPRQHALGCARGRGRGPRRRPIGPSTARTPLRRGRGLAFGVRRRAGRPRRRG
jgi:Bacterial PH domain